MAVLARPLRGDSWRRSASPPDLPSTCAPSKAGRRSGTRRARTRPRRRRPAGRPRPGSRAAPGRCSPGCRGPPASRQARLVPGDVAMPKSTSFTSSTSPRMMKTLLGLTSRWTRPLVWGEGQRRRDAAHHPERFGHGEPPAEEPGRRGPPRRATPWQVALAGPRDAVGHVADDARVAQLGEDGGLPLEALDVDRVLPRRSLSATMPPSTVSTARKTVPIPPDPAPTRGRSVRRWSCRVHPGVILRLQEDGDRPLYTSSCPWPWPHPWSSASGTWQSGKAPVLARLAAEVVAGAEHFDPTAVVDVRAADAGDLRLVGRGAGVHLHR